MLRSRLWRPGGSHYPLIMPETPVLQAVKLGGGLALPALAVFPFPDGPPLGPPSVQESGIHWRQQRTMSIAILGIDVGKNRCSVVGLDEGGRVVVRRRIRRDGGIAFAAGLTPCTMAMEACCGVPHQPMDGTERDEPR